VIVSAIGNLLGQVIGLFGERGKAKQASLDARVANLARSWTDEFITVVWFSPLIVAWFSPERSDAWIASITGQVEYFGMLSAITAAVFGLGKINGRKK